MLYTVFETVIKMNCAAAITAAVILPLKYLLEKLGLPRRVLFLLWIVIAFRLVCPFSPESRLSFWNMRGISEHETSVVYQTDAQTDEFVQMDLPAQTDLSESVPAEDAKRSILTAFASIWLCGIAAVLAYGAMSYIRLRKRLVFAVRYEDKIYLADNIPTAFVFGVFRAKIYIPASTDGAQLEYIIEHERTHIRRLDHISKLAAYVVFAVNWFNPVNWLLFRLFSDDMELACDECVIRKIGISYRKEYLNALLSAATGAIGAKIPYHVCFSESITKRRVRAMLKIKKFSAALTAVAVICCIAAAAAFGTNAESNNADIVQTEEISVDRSVQMPAVLFAEPTPSETPEVVSDMKSPDNGPAIQMPNGITEMPMRNREGLVPLNTDNYSGADKSVVNDSITTDVPVSVPADIPTDVPVNVPIDVPAIDEPEAAPANDYTAGTISRKSITSVAMGTNVDDVHSALGVRGGGTVEYEAYTLDDGSRAVLVYEGNILKSGYILEDSEG